MLESMKKRRGGRVLGDGVANVIKLRKTKKNFTTKGTKNTKKRQDFFINPFVNFVLFVVKNSYLNDIARYRLAVAAIAGGISGVTANPSSN